jgi:long-subunit fatty acid transport protein
MTQAQDFNFIGSGARARGMGGAFIGVADDATAMSWNPAGLAKLDMAEASVVGLYENYSVDTDIEDFDADAYASSHMNLNFVSAAFPLSVGARNLVAGVAYQQVMDLYSKYEDDFEMTERTGGVYAISPSVGVQLTPTVSIGAGVNIYTGSTDYKVEDKELRDTYEESYNYSGTNFNIGALFDFTQFRLGAVFKTPFGLVEKEGDLDWDVTYHMPQMLGFGASFQATENLVVAADYEMRKFSESELENNETEEKVESGWEDINQVRFGLEYLLMSGTSIIPLRLGFATTPTLFTDDEDNQITGANITGGFGIIMGNINLDVGVEYNTYQYEITGFNENFDYADNYLRFIVAGVFHFGQ